MQPTLMAWCCTPVLCPVRPIQAALKAGAGSLGVDSCGAGIQPQYFKGRKYGRLIKVDVKQMQSFAKMQVFDSNIKLIQNEITTKEFVISALYCITT